MTPAQWVIPNAVCVALEPHSARLHGIQGPLGVEERLVCQGDFHDVAWRPTEPRAIAPDAPKVPRLLGAPEAFARYFPKALVALSVPERY